MEYSKQDKVGTRFTSFAQRNFEKSKFKRFHQSRKIVCTLVLFDSPKSLKESKKFFSSCNFQCKWIDSEKMLLQNDHPCGMSQHANVVSNTAAEKGGAIYTYDNSLPWLQHCLILRNFAYRGEQLLETGVEAAPNRTRPNTPDLKRFVFSKWEL